jgi:protocatechuate 3,4-dioxygenase beta subunit
MTISRRDILGLGSLLLVGCGSRGTRRDAGVATALVATAHVDDDEGPPPAPIDAQTCGGATASNIEGPFYKAGAPHRAILADNSEGGARLAIAGTVLTTTCEPVAGAELDVWHADRRGGYDNDGFHLRGKLVTDANGRYELRTIVPGRYLNGDMYRPAHIHVKLRAQGHRTLTTQLYFPDDPHNDKDPFIVESLIMKTRAVRTGILASFDFVLG